MQLYTVEFYDSYQGSCFMDVMAKSEKDAMKSVNDMLGRNCALGAWLYN